MRQFFTLFKLNFRYYTLPDFSDKKSRKKYIALIVVLGLCFALPIIGMFMTLYATATLAFAQGGTVEMLSGVFCLSQIAVLFLSAFPYISSMFFAKDNEIMLNLPVSQTTVFASKLLVSYVNELLISTVIVLPATVITTVAAAQAGVSLGAQFYVLIPFAVLLLPLLPMLLLSLVSFPIALIIQKLSKKPVLGAIIQAVFLIAFVAGMYYISYSASYSVSDNGETLNIGQIFEPMAKVNVFSTMMSKAMFGQNAAGNFVQPSTESISAAATGNIPDDTRVMITNSASEDAYPVSCLTWILAYQEQAYDGRTIEQAKTLQDFLYWMIGQEAQAMTVKVHYAPLSADMAAKAKAQIASMTFNGQPIQ